MNNTYTSADFRPSKAEVIVRETWLSIVFVFGIIGNILLFSVILRRGKVTNVSNLFNLNLAVGDLIRIFFFIPVFLAYSADGEWPPALGLAGCKAIYILVNTSMTESILTLMFMSMERYQAVIHPLKKQMTIKLARYLVLLSWILGLVTSLWLALSLQLVKEETGRTLCEPRMKTSWLKVALILLLVGTQWIPGIVFMVAYVRIILKLRRDGVVRPSDVSQSSQNRHRRNCRAVRILVIEVVMFLACLYPSYQYSLMEIFSSSHVGDPLSLEGMITYCMVMTYSVTNPLAHLALNSEFRTETVKFGSQLKKLCRLEKKPNRTCPHCICYLRRRHTDKEVNETTTRDVEATV